jgi:hypothetical protein
MSERTKSTQPPGDLRIWRDQSGKSSIRGLIALVLIAGLVYFCFKFLPVRAAAYQFNDAINDEVVYASARRTNDDQIMQNLLEEATMLSLPIKRENITITRSGRKYIIIEAHYTVRIELVGGYNYDWTFDQRHEGPVY